jgi:hypothetical protein
MSNDPPRPVTRPRAQRAARRPPESDDGLDGSARDDRGDLGIDRFGGALDGRSYSRAAVGRD